MTCWLIDTDQSSRISKSIKKKNNFFLTFSNSFECMQTLRLKILSIVHSDHNSVLFQATQQTYNNPLLFKLANLDQLSTLQQNVDKVVDVKLEKLVDKHIPLVNLIRFEKFINSPTKTQTRKRPYRPELIL